MAYAIQAYEDSRQEGTGWFNVESSFKTRGEAEASLAKYKQARIYEQGMRIVQYQNQAPAPTILQSKEDRAYSSRQKSRRDRELLARQAAEKAEAGQQTSKPERLAYKQVTGEDLPPNIPRQRMSLADYNIQLEKERQQRVIETSQKIARQGKPVYNVKFTEPAFQRAQSVLNQNPRESRVYTDKELTNLSRDIITKPSRFATITSSYKKNKDKVDLQIYNPTISKKTTTTKTFKQTKTTSPKAPSGEITEYKKPALISPTPRYRIDYEAGRLEQEGGPAGTAAAFVLGITYPTVSLITQPGRTVGETINFATDLVKNPAETGLAFGDQLRERPGFTLGNIFGGFLGGKLLQKGVFKGTKILATPKIKKSSIAGKYLDEASGGGGGYERPTYYGGSTPEISPQQSTLGKNPFSSIGEASSKKGIGGSKFAEVSRVMGGRQKYLLIEQEAIATTATPEIVLPSYAKLKTLAGARAASVAFSKVLPITSTSILNTQQLSPTQILNSKQRSVVSPVTTTVNRSTTIQTPINSILTSQKSRTIPKSSTSTITKSISITSPASATRVATQSALRSNQNLQSVYTVLPPGPPRPRYKFPTKQSNPYSFNLGTRLGSPRKYRGTPSLSNVLGGARGISLTPSQQKGKAFINPLSPRSIGRPTKPKAKKKRKARGRPKKK